jgi:putative membrane protein
MMWGYGHDWGMMGGWGGGAFNMIIWPLVLVALIIGVIWFVRSPSYSGAGRLQLPRRSSGLDILEERYARGEINREEFLQKKQEISG